MRRVGAGVVASIVLLVVLWAGCRTASDALTTPRGVGQHRVIASASEQERERAEAAVRATERLSGDAFGANTFIGADGSPLAYRLLSPSDTEPGRLYPLIVVFHGAGEIGVDNVSHLDRFPKYWLRDDIREDFPAFVLAPQMPARSSIYSGPVSDAERSSESAPPLYLALELIDSIVGRSAIDPSRIYTIGFSMGASTALNALYLRPGFFAATIAIGGVPNAAHAADVARTPVWLIHGDRDEANRIDHVRPFYERLRGMNAPVNFWEFGDTGHVVPPRLQAGRQFAEWLFRHHR